MTGEGGNREGRWEGLGCWAGVGGKGRELYLNNNKIREEKKEITAKNEICI